VPIALGMDVGRIRDACCTLKVNEGLQQVQNIDMVATKTKKLVMGKKRVSPCLQMPMQPCS
jgi:hypothetical protein